MQIFVLFCLSRSFETIECLFRRRTREKHMNCFEPVMRANALRNVDRTFGSIEF